VPQRLFVLEPARPPETGLLSEGPRNAECRARGMAWMAQLSVCHVPVSPFRETSDRKSRMPKRAVRFGGRGEVKPSPYPYPIKREVQTS